jgi:hydroxyethylthiazole kinase-like uncharacterized protein yjeF
MAYSIEIIDALNLLNNLTRQSSAHKGHNGSVVCLGGSSGMAGAILLSAKSALLSGAGVVHVWMMDVNSHHVDPQSPEIMIHPCEGKIIQQITAINPACLVVGPGMQSDAINIPMLVEILNLDIPLVIDAGAINLISQNDDLLNQILNRQTFTVITPHPGEAARLLKITSDEVQKNREKNCLKLNEKIHCTVVLKGEHTLIANDQNTIYQCNDGNAGMASAGMGDVLAGLMGSMIAQGKHYKIDAFNACLLSVQLHAKAADQLVEAGFGPIGLTATELANQIRKLINDFI